MVSVDDLYDSVTELLGKSNNVQSKELIDVLKDQCLYDAIDKECKKRGIDTREFIKWALFKNDKGYNGTPMPLSEYLKIAKHYGIEACTEDSFLTK